MIYNISNCAEIIQGISHETITEKGTVYFNVPFSFDIETTSFKENDDKKCIMYIWQFAIENDVIIGRTWNEFKNLIQILKNILNLNEKRKIIVYIHNLSYEFQFLYKRFFISDIFADSERKPIKAEIDKCIILKCSYRLSGYNLATLAKNLKKPLKKMCGDLDYSLIRNSQTVLSDTEINYCIQDVLIVNEYIRESIAEYGDICNIPLTQTGKIRRLTRNHCMKNKSYKNFIHNLTLTKEEFYLLKNAFCGGFTHANAFYINQIMENVSSFDFTSSYPTVMISEKFPMSKGKQIKIESIEQIKKLSEKYNLVFDVELFHVKPKVLFENILSYSKCRDVVKPILNNGRIVSCETLKTTFTETDFFSFLSFYDFDSIKFGLCYIYESDYLPKEIIEMILKLYTEKTTLKGVKGKETEYLHSKELLNSLYGMTVTSIIHDTYMIKNHEWITENSDIQEEIEKYNQDKNRFLFFAWGVWVTTYARRNLYTAILECGKDYIYSDTDSVKILNAEKHQEYFKKYNEWIINRLENTLKHYDMKETIKPKTIKGIEKPLGVWDFEGVYQKFKTLGAKRYMIEKDNEIEITIAGLSKKDGKKYIEKQKKPFEFFDNFMYIPPENSGKKTHTYIDSEISGLITDYQGNTEFYNEKSFVHLENCSFDLSLAQNFIDYIETLKNFDK